MNKVDSVPNVPCTKITAMPVRKVTGKILRWSDTGDIGYGSEVKYNVYKNHCKKYPVCCTEYKFFVKQYH